MKESLSTAEKDFLRERAQDSAQEDKSEVEEILAEERPEMEAAYDRFERQQKKREKIRERIRQASITH